MSTALLVKYAHKSSPRACEITDPSWGQWWSSGAVHVKCTGPLWHAETASPTPNYSHQYAEAPSTVSLRAKSLPAVVQWILRSPIGVAFFFSVSFLFIISVCWWWVGHALPQHPRGGQRTTLGSQFSPYLLGSGDWIQLIRPSSKHRVILPASMDFCWALGWYISGSKRNFIHKYDINFLDSFHSEWLSLSICYDSISKMCYDLENELVFRS